ncbi:PREDICTED: probable plastid-lipid-associated protein 4, chloroplastic isoform X2 [Tarenaya hassleriana]|uniref:probable plastid-lipid-associated protein 4, chloroplastic isoform X2 n=1 Tax=Tarenaya hassleriana TaxID=28532 RepID=UPI00053C3FB3|nr:PREDICTED: probable plastid-lipid-associated protein 4, chloroplastic isoform X2 [Tarenaya hassleriana]
MALPTCFKSEIPVPPVSGHHFSRSLGKQSTLSALPTRLQRSLPTDDDRKRLKTRAAFTFPPAFLTKGGRDAKLKQLKQDLFDAIAPLNRGASATPNDQLRVDQIAQKLEAVNPTKAPLKSDLLNGKWELIYTTSVSILQLKKPRLLRSITNYQAIDADTLKVIGNLKPLNPRKVAVKFERFRILGLIPVNAPDTARGELEITYLDEELRVSRGDKGNLFILKMFDRSYRIPPP